MNPDLTKNLKERSFEIFKELVDTYIETGEAVGSRALSKRSQYSLSSATLRNIMADLEEAGLLYAPHTSSGRVPTDKGLKFFVDGLITSKEIQAPENKLEIDSLLKNTDDIASVFEQAARIISGLSKCAGILMSTKNEKKFKHVEFILINEKQILVILVAEDGTVENRVMEAPPFCSQEILRSISNYLFDKIKNKTIDEIKNEIKNEINLENHTFDVFTKDVLSRGLEIIRDDENASLIVRGQANLLEEIDEIYELQQIKQIFEMIDTKNGILEILETLESSDKINVFIGEENKHFKLSGCSVVVAPYVSKNNKLIGAIGVIGPSNMKYRRIIPVLDYTSKIISKIIKERNHQN